MDEYQKLLALDAACCAAEGCGPDRVRKALSELQHALDQSFGGCDLSFGEFLDQQKAAVLALANNPACFGGES